MEKKKIFYASLFLHRAIAKHFGMDIILQNKNNYIETQPMGYDQVNCGQIEKYKKYYDYARYRTMELVVDEIKRRYSDAELSSFCVAEAGVFLGDFAWMINDNFSMCDFHLYDTFNGFNKEDIDLELTMGYTGEKYMDDIEKYFSPNGFNEDEKISIVKSKMQYPQKCIFHKGYFPETADKEKNNKWIFVSLDMDLYKPISEGIQFFWPQMVEGGYMFIHDYNNKGFEGIKDAIKEAEDKFGKISKVPISDQGGTIVLCKI